VIQPGAAIPPRGSSSEVVTLVAAAVSHEVLDACSHSRRPPLHAPVARAARRPAALLGARRAPRRRQPRSAVGLGERSARGFPLAPGSRRGLLPDLARVRRLRLLREVVLRRRGELLAEWGHLPDRPGRAVPGGSVPLVPPDVERVRARALE